MQRLLEHSLWLPVDNVSLLQVFLSDVTCGTTGTQRKYPTTALRSQHCLSAKADDYLHY